MTVVGVSNVGPITGGPWAGRKCIGCSAGRADRVRQGVRPAVGREEQPVEPDTSFAVGSVTKQFTCACVFLLAEQGKLSVDDPVAKYYPRLTRAKDITLRDLMNHTAGYPDYYPLDFLDRRMLKPIAIDALLKEYAGGKLDFEPGTPVLVQQHRVHPPRRGAAEGDRQAGERGRGCRVRAGRDGGGNGDPDVQDAGGADVAVPHPDGEVGELVFYGE